MSIPRVWLALLAVACLGLALLTAADSDAVKQEQLARHRNLGKAYFENPTKKKEAVEEFRKALELAPDSARDRLNYAVALLGAGKTPEALAELQKVQKQDPSIPHTWFNLGIEYKKLGDFDRAIQQLEQMAKLVPREAVTQYNLGVLYKRKDRVADALKKFQLATELDPSLAAPHFQLFNSYRQAGQKEKAAEQLEIFKRIKAAQKGAAVAEDMNWSFYSEIYEPIRSTAAAGTPAPALKFKDVKLAASADASTAGLLALDADGNGRPDLLAWSSRGAALFLNGGKSARDAALASLKDVIAAAAADYDNDGRMDLCVVTAGGPVLLRNTGGRFQRQNAALPRRRFERAAWLDFDHDNDPDLFLLGADSALLRNQGAAGFVDYTKAFPFAPGKVAGAVVFRLIPDTKGMDLLVSRAGECGVLYKDRLGGVYDARPVEAVPAGARGLVAVDFNNDGRIDLAYTAGGKVGLLANRNGELAPVEIPAEGVPLFADLENRGRQDLVAGGRVYRNAGLDKFAPGVPVPQLPPAVAGAAADFDSDHREDLALVAEDGSVHLLENQTPTRNKWLCLTLLGKKAPKLAAGAVVEIKAGTRYQKKVYQGMPLLFGVDGDPKVDTIRITWPNGMIQNEMLQAANHAFRYEEEERLSGSCPMVWAWNGRKFQFIADVLGVALLGVKSGENSYFPGDSNEYVQIPRPTLVPRNGAYEIRITQELAEVAYLDRIQLLAVDHLAGIDIFTNEKFQDPPFPDLRLYGVGKRYYPVAARTGKGQDVRARLLRRDHWYPDDFQRPRPGVAEPHTLELDFGPQAAPRNDAVLVLHGWTDWSEGSIYMGFAQEGTGGLQMPSVQVKDERGQWRTVVENMGVPSGMPRPIVVDLAGKFPGKSRQVRIVTNMCLYWDEAFLAEGAQDPPVRVTALTSDSAGLRYRGFATVRVSRDGRQPQRFIYEWLDPVAIFNQTPGYYTRYGEVTELLDEVDDRFVILAAGDEIRLRFNAAALPPLAKGWKRDFILGVEGWEKDQDPNTAYSESVEPLPFHGMSGYPYPASESYPDDAFHRAYRQRYNTRPARRLVPPLAARLVPAPDPSARAVAYTE